MAEHVELSAVEGLVDLAVVARRLLQLLDGGRRAVDLHLVLVCVRHVCGGAGGCGGADGGVQKI